MYRFIADVLPALVMAATCALGSTVVMSEPYKTGDDKETQTLGGGFEQDLETGDIRFEPAAPNPENKLNSTEKLDDVEVGLGAATPANALEDEVDPTTEFADAP
ncbi:MAG: hypothetical protein AAF699_19890 [Pseudomonadota bacterium]